MFKITKNFKMKNIKGLESILLFFEFLKKYKIPGSLLLFAEKSENI